MKRLVARTRVTLVALALVGVGLLGTGRAGFIGAGSVALAAEKSRKADKATDKADKATEKGGKTSRTRPGKSRRNAPRSTPRRTDEPTGPRDVPEGGPPRERDDGDGVDGRASAAATPAADPDKQAPATAGARSGKPRVYTFGGLDLEGKLKTPQLLYFRGRMRQELDASSLQRRSFMKELENTGEDRGL